MGTYNTFKSDQDLEQKGLTLDLGDAGKFKIARAGGSNERYHQKLFAVLKPHRRAIQAGTFDPKLDRQLGIEVFVDSVLQGWENVTDEAGQPLPFNKANAVKLFIDLPDLFQQLQQHASDASLYRAVEREADAKN